MSPLNRNFNSILRRDHQINSYERRAYESVIVCLVMSEKRRKKEFDPWRVNFVKLSKTRREIDENRQAKYNKTFI